jgi:hypothetical protein
MICPVCYKKVWTNREGDILTIVCHNCGYINERRIA